MPLSQQKLLLEENGKQNDPRNQIIQDLVDEIKPIIERGQNIILAGDFNEKIWSKEKLSDKLYSIGRFNVFENRMETKSLPRTFSRGTEAIDHIWTTKFILDNISYAGMAPFNYGYDSDHRGLFIDIADSVLFVALTKGTEQEKEIKSIIQTEKSRDQAE